MSNALFSPIFNAWQGLTNAGVPLSGGLIGTYLAGTSTPSPTYTTGLGNIANTNPIVLDSAGRPPSEIWLIADQAYKFVLADSLSNTIGTYDNVFGIPAGSSSVWLGTGFAPTYLNPQQFSVIGDQTLVFPVGIRVRYTLGAIQFYGLVTAVSFAAGVTTVTLLVDATPLTSALNNVDVSEISPINSPLPSVYSAVATFNAGIATTGDNFGVGLAIARYKPATTSRASTVVYTDDPNLIIPLRVGTWAIDCFMSIWATTSGAGGFKQLLLFTGTNSSSVTAISGVANGVVGAWTTPLTLGVNGAYAATTITVAPTLAQFDWMRMVGTITVTAPGNLKIQWGQVASNVNPANVGAGSWLICTRVA